MEFKRNKIVSLRVSLLSLATFIALAFYIPYLWNQPVREVDRIQKSLSEERRLDTKERAELINKKRDTLVSSIGTGATIVGGIVLLINVYLATKRLNLDATKIEDDKKLTESRLISERFSRAIEQLGSENIHIRLGGIYSLEKIAKDSSEDYWTIIEVLTAFIREESPASKVVGERDRIINDETESSNDIRAALTAIGRRYSNTETSEYRNILSLNLSRTNLNGAVLNTARLDGAELRFVHRS